MSKTSAPSPGSCSTTSPSCTHPHLIPHFLPHPVSHPKVKDLIHRLDNFDGPAVADKAIEFGLFEEAFEIYKKFNKKVEAIKVGGWWEKARECVFAFMPRVHRYCPGLLSLA